MKFKLLLADWDSPLFRAAKGVQQDYVEVKHIKSGNVKEFENKTKFYGHWKKKAGGWLAAQNEEREAAGKPLMSPDDFEITECARLHPEIHNHLEEAMNSFDFSVGRLKKSVDAEEYKLVIGGEGNFRYEAAKQAPYKGGRTDKPLIFSDLKEAVIKKYRSKIVVVNGREADDYCSALGYKNYRNFCKTGIWDMCLGFIDKDLKMIISPSINYDDDKPEVVVPTAFDAAKYYALQLLMGDSTDNIPGLSGISDELGEKYGIKSSRGVGSATANGLLESCEEIKDLFDRVVEAYKSHYGEEEHDFTLHTGEVERWTWQNYLQDNANLLWMHRKASCKYDIFKDTLTPLGVDY